MTTATLFDPADVPALPAPDADELAAFEAWMTDGAGRDFFAALDAFCLRLIRNGLKDAPAWQTILVVKAMNPCNLNHDFMPYLSRLWMIHRNRPGFFKTCALYRCTEEEVTAACGRILAAWAEGREAA